MRLLFALLTTLVAACDLVAEPGLEVTVDNQNDGPAALEVIEAPDIADGPPQALAPPIRLEPGVQEIVLAAPVDRWALRARGGRGFLFSDDLGYWSTNGPQGSPDGFHIVVTADGEVEARNSSPAP